MPFLANNSNRKKPSYLDFFELLIPTLKKYSFFFIHFYQFISYFIYFYFNLKIYQMLTVYQNFKNISNCL